MLDEMLAAHNRWLEELMKHMSAAELDRLIDGLGILKNAMKKADARLAEAASMDEDLTAGAAAGVARAAE
jgi:uncharacterized protein (DUF2342 family)